MDTRIKRTAENNSQSVACLTRSQNSGKSNERSQQTFLDNRPQTQTLQTLQAKASKRFLSSSQQSIFPLADPLQLAPATAVGSTHLVEKKGKSILNGKEVGFVEHGDELDVDPHSRIISRRGPNQELVGDYDRRGEHMYRWYKIDQHNKEDLSADDAFIREKTFLFDNEKGDHQTTHDLESKGDRRGRQTHIAVRFEVWYNTSTDIDPSGHMVMADKSKEYQGVPPYYAYEMGDKDAPQDDPKGPFNTLNEEETHPELDNDNTQVTVDDARTKGARVPGRFKSLDQERETSGEVNKRLMDRQKYQSAKDPEKWFNVVTEEHRQKKNVVNRFNKKKWIEILVTQKEYQTLMKMWEVRKVHGFYCFVREARTKIGYAHATRCLSSLEDIAIMRQQKNLKAGHALEILKHFAELNQVTRKHTGSAVLP